jgi:hypothetical protein
MRTVLFTVERLEFIGSGKFMVGGRNCRDELRRGDRLRLTKGCGSEEIEVQVDEITMYNRTVTDVAHSMTAGLFFSNDLAGHFRLGSELHGDIG